MFKKGMLVLKTFHGIEGYEEYSIRAVAKVENGVAYVTSDDVDDNGEVDLSNYEWGITHNAADGMEIERFFPGMYATIVPLI